MKESKFNWPRLFKPICILAIPMGALWALSLFALPADFPLGKALYAAGGVLLLLGGVFGLIGKPRSLVPLLDFLSLVAGLAAFWQVGFAWQSIASVVLAAFYLVSCNATTLIGDDVTENPEPDYSELHPWWENMEAVKKQFEERDTDAQKAAEEQASPKE